MIKGIDKQWEKVYNSTNSQCWDKGKQNDHGKQTEQKKKQNEKEKKKKTKKSNMKVKRRQKEFMFTHRFHRISGTLSAEKKEGISRGWLTSYTAIDNTLSKYIYLILPKNSPGGFWNWKWNMFLHPLETPPSLANTSFVLSKSVSVLPRCCA